MKIFSKILLALFLTCSVVTFSGCSTNNPNNSSSVQESKVVTKTEVKEEKIPFETKQENDATLAVGQTKTKQDGTEGVKELKYSVTYQDGKEVKRSLVSETVTVEPIVKITSVGTKASAPTPSTNSGYTNVDGNYVPSPSNNPAGATAKCKDGTYSYSQNRSGTCSHHGGVAVWY